MTTWAGVLKDLPVLLYGHSADLCFSEAEEEGNVRVWLSRCGIADGEPFAATVYVEQMRDGKWEDVDYFDGNERDPKPVGVLGAAYDACRAWRQALQGASRMV